MKMFFSGLMFLALVFLPTLSVEASSHREAQAVLEDPAIDNTDMYAWVSDGDHSLLYLTAGYNGLHEPGQGNQQTRLGCNVLYEFHISRGTGELDDEVTYQILLNCGKPPRVDVANLNLSPGGGKEVLVQLGGATFTYNVTKVVTSGGVKTRTLIGNACRMAPPNVGPATDRIAYGLGSFTGYDAGNSTQFEDGLYNKAFVQSFICDMGAEGRAFVGVMDDAYQLDEKGIFDILNLANLPGGRKTPGEDVFAGFNLNVMALEIPTEKVLGKAIPHNGVCGDDTLLSVWASASRRKERILRANGDPIESGAWIQVGRQGLPLINAGVIGVQDQNKFLRTTPRTDVENFASYFLNPILVRDVEFLGIYRALGVPQATVDKLKTNRVDILKVINLDDIPAKGCHHVPIEPGKTGDVLRLDVATDSQFPNGRKIGGGKTSKDTQVDVSDVLISLILTGDPNAGLGDGVNFNDKPYLTEFPFYALPHQGLNGGHGKPAK
ncbi:MAG TPA: DUF4331 domain-containing protein [Acidobacteriota bacterium]|nr:DUF4331 domain-containing protein [Acidobacteriota bacterium]